MADATSTWFPLFEFQDWTYESTLVLPTSGEALAAAGSAVTARKWARGALALGQAMRTADGYSLGGQLTFAPGVGLDVSASGELGSSTDPAVFKGIGTSTDGVTKGSVYELLGWVVPEAPIANGAARVLRVEGSVRAVRGPDTNPGIELGKMPVGTVGSFVIRRTEA